MNKKIMKKMRKKRKMVIKSRKKFYIR